MQFGINIGADGTASKQSKRLDASLGPGTAHEDPAPAGGSLAVVRQFHEYANIGRPVG